MPADARTQAQDALAAHILSHPWVRTARVIAGYAAIDGEADIMPVLLGLAAARAQSGDPCIICLPSIEADAMQGDARNGMVFRMYDSVRWPLVIGPHNIPAPLPDAPLATPDVILMPLVGFDAHGNRLGYGGGYYDRALAHHAARRIGVAFDFQRLDALPAEPHDVKMHAVITDRMVYDAAMTKDRE